MTVPIETKAHGKIYFYIWQELGTERIDDEGRQRFRLNTLKYAYRIQEDRSLQADAIIRWEYDRSLRADKRRACRHHVQMAGKLGSEGQFDLNKLHTPTGWVLLESVIRFLIHDLGVKPPCGNRWPDVLHESEEQFHQSFSSKHD